MATKPTIALPKAGTRSCFAGCMAHVRRKFYEAREQAPKVAAGERSAIIYTVIASCRRRGIDPFAYLREVFTRLPTMTNWQVKDLTPEAWAKTHSRVDLRATA